MIVVKIEFEGDIRRVSLEEKTTFPAFLELLRELFKNSPLPESWVLRYKDEDGTICLSQKN